LNTSGRYTFTITVAVGVGMFRQTCPAIQSVLYFIEEQAQPMDIDRIRALVQDRAYLVKQDAILHAIKEGFNRDDMVAAILSGQIIEEYPERERVLICGPTSLSLATVIYLHVVCEYSDPNYVQFVSAYIPDELSWEWPPFRRKRRRK
jgi:hypothetical protein